MAEVRNVKKDELNVRIFDSRQSMGEAAAEQAAQWIREVAAQKEEEHHAREHFRRGGRNFKD